MLNQSNILIHWSGKQFHPTDEGYNFIVSFENITDEISKEYLNRLRSFKNNGLYMQNYHEKVIGYDLQGFQVNKTATCFTDLGVLNSYNHVKIYGLMGIGVSRKFVLERDGRPVWYLLNSPEDLIAPTFEKFYKFYLDNKNDHPELNEIYMYMSNMVKYLKGMGEVNTTDFDYLQESEWRIIFSQRVLEKGLIIRTGQADPEFVIPIDIDDVELLIMPNRRSRELLYQDPELREWICSAKTMPMIISLEEYYSF